jgi:hypothetical protein
MSEFFDIQRATCLLDYTHVVLKIKSGFLVGGGAYSLNFTIGGLSNVNNITVKKIILWTDSYRSFTI